MATILSLASIQKSIIQDNITLISTEEVPTISSQTTYFKGPNGNVRFNQYTFNRPVRGNKLFGLTRGLTELGTTTSNQIRYRFPFGNSGYYLCFVTFKSGNSYYITAYITNGNNSDTPNYSIMQNGTSVILGYFDYLPQYDQKWDFVIAKYNNDTLIGAWQEFIEGSSTQGSGLLINLSQIEKGIGAKLDVIEKDTEYGSYSTSGGYSGSFDDSSDTIGIPAKPSLSVASMGFVNVYKPNANTLNGMIDELFPQVNIPDIPTGSEITDVVNSLNVVTESIINGIIQFSNKNLLDYVLDAHIIPVTPTYSDNNNIKVGYKTLSNTAPKVIDDYVDFDCGTINIKEYYGNYIDYTTKIKLYLPFVGFVPLQPELVLDGELNVVYRFNVLDGSFCAWVLSTSSKSKLSKSIVGSFSGNCCVHVPISATNYANIISGMVNGVSGMLNSLPKASTSVKGNVSGFVDSTSDVIQALKPDVTLSNGYNATSSYSGIRYPYLIIERQVASFSKTYVNENGLPLNVSDTIGNYSGFTVASDLILDNISASDDEKTLIKNLFKEGVIL